MVLCPDCRSSVVGPDQSCRQCKSRMAWGVILGFLAERWREDGADEAIEAAAQLMQIPARMRHEHRKELRDVTLDAARESRESYREGLDSGRREGQGDW